MNLPGSLECRLDYVNSVFECWIRDEINKGNRAKAIMVNRVYERIKIRQNEYIKSLDLPRND